MERSYIAAIDFGTSRTGFAWCVRGETSGTASIKVRKDWPGLPGEYVKTYSELCHDPENDKWYYGGEAHNIRLKGKDLYGNEVRGNFFQEYKMNLYDTALPESEERQYETMDLVVQTLKYMKEQVWENMRANLGLDALFDRKTFEREVQWVLTVPEGATDDNKYFMRQAAETAGLIQKGVKEFDRLMFTLEPEAAVITCILDNIAQKFIEDDQVCVVFDAGGGTVDVTARRYRPKSEGSAPKLSSIKGIYGACEPAGSKYTNTYFFEYLATLFGGNVCSSLLKEYEEDYHKVMWDWLQGKERTIQYRSGEDFEIDVDVSELWYILRDLSPEEYQKVTEEIEADPDKTICRGNFAYKFSGRKNKCLSISRKIFTDICRPAFENAYSPLKKVLRQLKREGEVCNSLFFVGGFSCNPCLREYIKEQIAADFPNLNGLRYVEMEGNKMCSAVLLGAVSYGENPEIIADRIVKLTYGTDCADEVFSPLVLKGDKISFEKEIQSVFNPIKSNQTRVDFTFFSTDRTDVTKTTDPSLKRLKAVSIDCPDITGGCSREILVTLKFGGTETIATILDKTSGNQKKVSFHMPFSWNK